MKSGIRSFGYQQVRFCHCNISEAVPYLRLIRHPYFSSLNLERLKKLFVSVQLVDTEYKIVVKCSHLDTVLVSHR